jgi:hypothetical protein
MVETVRESSSSANSTVKNMAEQVSDPAAAGAGRWAFGFTSAGLRLRRASEDVLGALTTVAGQIGALTHKASPVGADVLLLEDSEASGAKRYATIDEVLALVGAGGLYDAYLCYADQKAQGTSGGTFTEGAWRTRDLNTEKADTAAIGSLNANEVTLPAGTYRCDILAPAYAVNRHQARLYDVTGSAVLLYGTSMFAYNTGQGYNQSVIKGRFTLAVESALRVEHYCQVTNADDGFGVGCNFGPELFTVAEFWREVA